MNKNVGYIETELINNIVNIQVNAEMLKTASIIK